MDAEKVFEAFVYILVILCVYSVLLAFPTMWLWNWLMPVIFGLPIIDFWQALGLCVLSSILIKSSSTSSNSK